MTNSAAILGAAFLAGALIGAFHFGGLRFTVQRLPNVRHPARTLVASTILRTSITLLAFYLVMGGTWQRLLSCLLGFLATRTLLSLSARPSREVAPVEGVRNE
jgi:F1F0 ATPase subunit 2